MTITHTLAQHPSIHLKSFAPDADRPTELIDGVGIGRDARLKIYTLFLSCYANSAHPHVVPINR